MRKSLSKETKELCRELAIQGLPLATIGLQTGVNANTISTWQKRERWTALRSKTCETLTKTGEKLATLTIAEASSKVRHSLAQELQTQTEILVQNPVKAVSELANCP